MNALMSIDPYVFYNSFYINGVGTYEGFYKRATAELQKFKVEA